MDYDIFISHASEDKAEIARPLADHLKRLGLRVWLDEFELTLGDSLRRSIDHGLAGSRFGVVILSPAFFRKEWPNKELDGLVSREDGSEKVILPVWHRVSRDDIVTFSPILADKIAVSTSHGLEHVGSQILHAVTRGASEVTRSGTSLEELGQKMLVADSSQELRRILYQLEIFLAQAPLSVEGRLLKDKLQVAIHRTEIQEKAQLTFFVQVWKNLGKKC